MRANSVLLIPRWGALLACLMFSLFSPAQDATSNVSCAFDDGKQVSLRFTASHPSEHLHNGKIWTPGDAPMFLFTQADLKIGTLNVPTGAYSLYVIPEKDKWTLIVNKKVEAAGSYDEKQDLGRATIDLGELGQSVDSPQLALGHAGPKQCNLRINFEKIGAWGEFHEQ